METSFTVDDVKLEGSSAGIVAVTVRGYDVAFIEPLDNGSARVAVVAWTPDGDHLTPLPEFFSQVQAVEARDNPYAAKAMRLRAAMEGLITIRDSLEGAGTSEEPSPDKDAYEAIERAFDYLDSAISTFENPEE